jgi:hypothetical protein
MWPSANPVKLLRYLCVWRVNSSLVRLPRCFSMELSQVIGTIISNRLPTSEAQQWRKALAQKDRTQSITHALSSSKQRGVSPELTWPIDAVLFVYPGKVTYGYGELIFWELKLMGKSADHNFFMELILPAMEEAGFSSGNSWNYRNSIWGQFDIKSVYVANGHHWKPLVKDGQLNLHYTPTLSQWANGLLDPDSTEKFYSRISWITPFDFGGIFSSNSDICIADDDERTTLDATPSLYGILGALILRLNMLLRIRRKGHVNVWDILNPNEQSLFQSEMEHAAQIPLRRKELVPTAKTCPGRWIGVQMFSELPQTIIPYLELASILHVGKQTHCGCGTFFLR